MNKRTIYSTGYDQYEFKINIEERRITIYENDCCPQQLGVLDRLPEGFTWENIESIFQNGDHKKEISDLAIKIYEMYEKNKEL